MNAVTSGMSETQGAMLPALQADAAAQPSPAFLSLLFLIGGNPPQEIPEDQAESNVVQTANPNEIAQAVIRSMLRSGSGMTTLPQAQTSGDDSDVSGNEPKHKKCSSNECSKEPAIDPVNFKIADPALVPVIPVQTESVQASAQDIPVMATTAPIAAVGNEPRPGAPAQTVPQPPRARAEAPLAFALRLTPHESADPQGIEVRGVVSLDAQSKGDAESKGSGDGHAKESNNHSRSETASFMPEISTHAVAPAASSAIIVECSAIQSPASAVPTKVPDEAPAFLPPAPPQVDAPAKSAPAHEIAIRVSAPDQSNVDVHVAQRGGEVHVAVRTADSALQTSLHDDLGTLVGRLERSGFHTETLSIHATPALGGSGNFGSREHSPNSNTDEQSSNRGYSGERQSQQNQHRRQHANPQGRWRKNLEENV